MNNNENLFHYVACGLSNVWLNGGVSTRDTPNGSVFHVTKVKELHNAIGLNLVNKKGLLNPDEFRFLRTEMNFSRKNLGEILDVSQETIKKWESGENPIQKTSEAWLRHLYLKQLQHDDVRDLITEINTQEKQELKICLAMTSQGWKGEECSAQN